MTSADPNQQNSIDRDRSIQAQVKHQEFAQMLQNVFEENRARFAQQQLERSQDKLESLSQKSPPAQQDNKENPPEDRQQSNGVDDKG